MVCIVFRDGVQSCQVKPHGKDSNCKTWHKSAVFSQRSVITEGSGQLSWQLAVNTWSMFIPKDAIV